MTRSSNTEQSPANPQDLIALEVNGEAITLPELLSAAQFRGYLGFLHSLADQVLIRQAATQQGIEVSDEELQAAADQFRTRHELHKAAELLKWLADRHLSLAVWESLLEEEILTDKLRAKLTDGTVELHFAQNKLSFEAATISRIVVATESLAKELRSQILEEDADFYALARQHSIDAATRPASGYAGVVRREDLVSTLEAAIFGAVIGAVVGPFKTEAGWELVKVEAQHPAPLLREKRARDRVARVLGVAPPDLRFHVVREQDGRAGKRFRQVHHRREKIADDGVEAAVVEELLQRRLKRGGAVLRDRVRRRIDDVARGVEIEAGRPLRGIGAGNRLQVCTDRVHALMVGHALRRLRERQVGDVVAHREAAHQVPRAELAPLVERQQEARVQPENVHRAHPSVFVAVAMRPVAWIPAFMPWPATPPRKES